jgi:fluoride exporter
MSGAAWVAFVVAAAIGALARYLLDGYVQSRTGGDYPWGTFVINASGSLLLGVLTGLALHHGMGPTTKTVLGTGFCGAFTTFSTFTFETVRLAELGATWGALRNVATNALVGGALAGLGLVVTR